MAVRQRSATGANLTEASLVDTYAANANFTNANLTGADLTGAELSELGTTDPQPAIWDNTICPDGTNSDDHGDSCEAHLARGPGL